MSVEERGVRVAKGSMYMFVQGALSSVFSILFYIVAARKLPVEDIGVIAAITLFTSLIGTLAVLSVPTAVTKYISEYTGRRPDLAKAVFEKSMLIGVIVSAAAAGVSVPCLNAFSMTIFGSRVSQLIIYVLSFCIFAQVLGPFLTGVLYGLQKFKVATIIMIIGSSLSIGVMILLLIQGYGLWGVIVGWAVSGVISLVITIPVAFSPFRGGNGSTAPFLTTKMIKYSIPLYFTSILAYASSYIDKYIILVNINLTSLGIYSVAISATSALSLLPSAMKTALFPQLSELYGGSSENALKIASIKASRYVFLMFIPMCVGLALISNPILVLVFGNAYGIGYIPLAIISIAIGFTCLTTVTDPLLMSIEATRVFLEVSAVSIVTDIVVSLMLIPELGMNGAALGRVAMILVGFGYYIYRLRGVYGVHFDKEALVKAWIASIFMGAIVGITELLYMSTVLLPVYILVGVVAYLVMLRLLHAVKKDDFDLIKKLLPKSLVKSLAFFERVLG